MLKHAVTIILAFVSGVAGAALYQWYGQKAEKNGTSPFFTHYDERPYDGAFRYTENYEKDEVQEGHETAMDFVFASKVSTPSVVYLKTMLRVPQASTWMEWFFGNQGAQAISSGSGVIYSSDGYIITNNHVIESAEDIEVVIQKRTFKASVVGTDPSSDLAVLKIEAQGLPFIRFTSSQEVQVGERVLAVGNPFNLTSTVTAGIVSAKGRELNILRSVFPIESFIQTDAAINPGNSGGALVNMRGELVGINTAILSKTGSYAGYGFAVPSDIVKKVVDDLINFGEVQKAFFGAEVLDINSDIAEKLKLNSYDGVVVGYVQESGGASRAGIEKSDIILKINGQNVNSRSEFEEILSYHSPGDQINVVFRRNQKTISSKVVLTNREGTTEILQREIYTSRVLGADLERVSKVERDLYGIEHGVRIVKVRSGFIRQLRLEEGFIVAYINKIPIKDAETLNDILEKIRGRVVIEGVNRRGKWEQHRYYF
ncbi:MAG: trypsin-like peptidase domain-containing protein [Cyclobacteriaceae bacterium]|nr:trypsin-like peptidase domain-containing protein [Cyclobacteriaceae bacterium]